MKIHKLLKRWGEKWMKCVPIKLENLGVGRRNRGEYSILIVILLVVNNPLWAIMTWTGNNNENHNLCCGVYVIFFCSSLGQ